MPGPENPDRPAQSLDAAYELLLVELLAEIRSQGVLWPSETPPLPSERPTGQCATCDGPIELVTGDEVYLRHLLLADLDYPHVAVWSGGPDDYR